MQDQKQNSKVLKASKKEMNGWVGVDTDIQNNLYNRSRKH